MNPLQQPAAGATRGPPRHVPPDQELSQRQGPGGRPRPRGRPGRRRARLGNDLLQPALGRRGRRAAGRRAGRTGPG